MATLLTVQVGAFLDANAAQPFVWGQNDCALMLANWGIEYTGIDAAAHLRGTYDSPMSCLRVMRQYGGLEGVLQSCADVIQWERRSEARPGDVGIIGCVALEPGPWGGVGAVCLDGRLWGARGVRGVVVAPGEPLHIWGAP
jgi:hypothetical protein